MSSSRRSAAELLAGPKDAFVDGMRAPALQDERRLQEPAGGRCGGQLENPEGRRAMRLRVNAPGWAVWGRS